MALTVDSREPIEDRESIQTRGKPKLDILAERQHERDTYGRLLPGHSSLTAKGKPEHYVERIGRNMGLTATLRMYMESEDPDRPGYTVRFSFIEAIVRSAMRGNATMACEVLNRLEGKVADKLITTEIKGWSAVPSAAVGEELT